MRQWFILLQKEILEMARNFKWIWMPITFILIGVQNPLITYYTPKIIKSAGNLPKGAVIKLPTPSAAEVLIGGLSDYTTLGVLVIVLSMMGLIAAERKSGVAALILVKPVSYLAFVTAKWAGGLIMVWFSFFIGYLATWYYTGILFDWVPIGHFFQSFFFYGLWLTFILTITIFFSASLLTPGIAGFLSLAVTIVITVASSSLSKWLKWSPSRLTEYANQVLMSKSISDYLLPACLTSAVCIIVLLVLSVVIFRKKELAA